MSFRSRTFPMKSQDKMNKALTLSKASKWEMSIFVKRVFVPVWGTSLTGEVLV